MHRGYVKNFRKITEWEWYKKPYHYHLFSHIILKANHKTNKWQGKDIERGQLITGTIKLSEETGISRQTVRTILNNLKSTNEITIKSTNKFSLITVCNYDIYQVKDSETNQQIPIKLTNNQPTTNQQLTTNKNDNNIKNEKNLIKPISFEDYKISELEAYNSIIQNESFFQEQQKFYPNLDLKLTLEKAHTNFWSTEAGWKNKKKSKSKEIDWVSTFKNALSQKINQVWKSKEQQLTLEPKKQSFQPPPDELYR